MSRSLTTPFFAALFAVVVVVVLSRSTLAVETHRSREHEHRAAVLDSPRDGKESFSDRVQDQLDAASKNAPEQASSADTGAASSVTGGRGDQERLAESLIRAEVEPLFAQSSADNDLLQKLKDGTHEEKCQTLQEIFTAAVQATGKLRRPDEARVGVDADAVKDGEKVADGLSVEDKERVRDKMSTIQAAVAECKDVVKAQLKEVAQAFPHLLVVVEQENAAKEERPYGFPCARSRAETCSKDTSLLERTANVMALLEEEDEGFWDYAQAAWTTVSSTVVGAATGCLGGGAAGAAFGAVSVGTAGTLVAPGVGTVGGGGIGAAGGAALGCLYGGLTGGAVGAGVGLAKAVNEFPTTTAVAAAAGGTILAAAAVDGIEIVKGAVLEISDNFFRRANRNGNGECTGPALVNIANNKVEVVVSNSGHGCTGVELKLCIKGKRVASLCCPVPQGGLGLNNVLAAASQCNVFKK